MASKNLDETILMAMQSGPASEFRKNLKNELRDFFAHQTLYETKKYQLSDGSFIKGDADQILLGFFETVFGGDS